MEPLATLKAFPRFAFLKAIPHEEEKLINKLKRKLYPVKIIFKFINSLYLHT